VGSWHSPNLAGRPEACFRTFLQTVVIARVQETVEALAQERPDLVQEITEAAVTGFKTTVTEEAEVTQLKADLKTAKDAEATATAKLRENEIGSVTRETVMAEGSGIPSAVREPVVQRVVERVKGLSPDKTAGDALKVTVKETVAAEAKYIADAAGKPKVIIPASKREGDAADDKTEPRKQVGRLLRDL